MGSPVSTPESQAPSRPRWYVSSAPPRQRLTVIAVETLASLVALVIVAALTALTHDPWLIPPLAASMALVVGGANFPLSQPRNVIGGHVMSAIVGVLVGMIGIDSLWAGALAGALALGTMKLLRISHSPAAATAMIAVAPAIPRWAFVTLGPLDGGRRQAQPVCARLVPRPIDYAGQPLQIRGGCDVSLPRGVALLVAGTLFMEILDATIITPAIPLIAHSFKVDPLDVNLAITAYLVTVAVLIPVSGWMSDRFGTRRVFIAAIAVFTLASVGCAASMSLTMLVAMRVVQGIGGALMVPVGRLLVLRSTEKRDLVRAIALLTWPALAAPVIAPILGGAVATFGSWRWIFIANIPLGIIGFLFALKLIHGKGDSNPAPLDWRGLAALGTGIAAALIAMEGIRVQGTNWGHVAIGGAVAAVALTVAVLHLLRYRYPLVELRVLRVPTLRITVSAGSLYRLVITAVPFLLPLQFQLAFGWTPLVAGSLVAALFAGNIAIKPFTTPLMRRFGIRRVLVANGVLSVGCFCLLATLTEHTPVALIAFVLFLSGALRSTGFTAYNSLAFSDVEAAELAHANTLNAAVQELAAGIGIAVAAVLLGLFTPIAHSAGQAYPWTYLTLGLLIAFTLIETLRLPKEAGDAVARQPPRSR